ncbi:hypothetical protein PEX2_038050 [Penicillium expansum]|uniref:Uncharacterized protein n=1 Tax=Penicillium expansum TaxID=27334 RepID=A0A0A2J0N7_PENEN|nr:hypothetical protein PEX2_038050 [Penicillium expansum]KGO45955.1 hypothetical protein PEXP_018350 [Penicillium expansum]KGO54317.1 hypothetical protein PEX2_038050 [Penicillium expansum]
MGPNGLSSLQLPPIPSQAIAFSSASLSSKPLKRVQYTSTPTHPHHHTSPLSPSGTCTTTSMNGQAAAITPLGIRRAFEAGIVNLRASIDRLDAMANNPPFNPAEFEALSEQILDTKIEFAKQIRRWRNRRDAVILANLYGRLIGAMPDDDGVIP